MKWIKNEEKIKDFLINLAFPLITDKDSGDTTYLMSKFVRYSEFLDKEFKTITVWNKKEKHCNCVSEIIQHGKMTALQILIFIIQHKVCFSPCSGYFNGHNNLEDACYFNLAHRNHITIDFCFHEDILENNTQLCSIVKGAFNSLKGKYCKKYYIEPDLYPPFWIEFNNEYWKLQADLFYAGRLALSNKGCYGRKAGIFLNKECKDCKYFASLDDFHHCNFDYWKKYGEHHTILLPNNGKTYACKHFDVVGDGKINGKEEMCKL